MSICTKCCSAGDQNQHYNFQVAETLHSQCEYKDCVCQHRTGLELIAGTGKVYLIKTQSP